MQSYACAFELRKPRIVGIELQMQPMPSLKMNRMLPSMLWSPTILVPHRIHVRLCAKLPCRKVSQTSCLSFGTIRSYSSFHPSKPLAKSPVLHPSGSSAQIKDDRPIQEARLGIVFTCTVEACSHRSSHTFTKRAYERGIVIVQCPGCKNRCGLFDLVFTKSHNLCLPRQASHC